MSPPGQQQPQQGYQPQQQQQGFQQQQQMQQQQQQPNQQQPQQQPQHPMAPPPPPPPANGLTTPDGGMTLAGVLHFLQTEWRRWERDRNEWEIERAEMRARIALLEGERRSAENLKLDLSRRVKMLEFALRQERAKHTSTAPSAPSAGPAAGIPPNKLNALQAEATEGKDNASTGSEGGSDDGAAAPPSLPNGASTSPPLASATRPGSTGSAPNGAPVPGWKTGVAAAGRDPKSRQRSRDYLKQCLQEITYLTSPGALNPLPNRPVILPPAPSASADQSYASQSRQPNPVPSQQPPSQNAQHDQHQQPSQIPQPTILQRPRKHLPDHVPPSPLQGVPPTIQEQQDVAAEKEKERLRITKRDELEAEWRLQEAAGRAEREAATLESGPPPRSTAEDASEDAQAESREDAVEPSSGSPSSSTGPSPSSSLASVESHTSSSPPSSHSSSLGDRSGSSPPSESHQTTSEHEEDHLADETVVHSSNEDDAAPQALNGSAAAFEDAPTEDAASDPFEEERDIGADAKAEEAEDDGDGSLEAVPLHEPIAVNFEHGREIGGPTNEEETEEVEDDDDEEGEAGSRLTAIFRPQDQGEWKEKLRAAGASIKPSAPETAVEPPVAQNDEDQLANLTLDDDQFDDDESPAAGTTSEGGAWRARRTLKSHLDAVRSISFHPTDLSFATGSDDCTVKIWRLSSSDLSPDRTTSKDAEPQKTFRGHTAGVTSVVLAADQKRVFSGSLDSTIRVWKLPAPDQELYADHDPKECEAVLVGHSDSIWGLALIGERLVSVGADGNVKVWDTKKDGIPLVASWGYGGTDAAEDAEEKVSKDGERIVPTSVTAVGTDPKLVAVGYSDSIVKLFEVETGKETLEVKSDESYDGTPATQINSLLTHPSLPLLITAHEDHLIRFFSLPSGTQSYVLPAHSDAVTSLALSPSSSTLVSGGHDSSLRIWDLESKEFVQEVTLHRRKNDQGVLAVAFGDEGKVMVSAGADGVVKVLTWVA